MSAKLWPPASAHLAGKKKKVYFFSLFLYIYQANWPVCSEMDNFDLKKSLQERYISSFSFFLFVSFSIAVVGDSQVTVILTIFMN